jgi:type IVB pilus formation R64 PilN family outer membrane protein
MRVKLSSPLLLVFLCLAGCSELVTRSDQSFGDPGGAVANLVKNVGRTAPGVVVTAPPGVEHKDGIWLGKKIVKVGAPPLPAIFLEPTTFDRTVSSLSELAERITLRSGIPTKVSPDAIAVANGAAAPVPAAAPGVAGALAAAGVLPPPMVPMLPMGRPGLPMGAPAKNGSGVHLAYSNGNFKNFLDMAAARFGVYWKYANGVIQFYHIDSRNFQINAVPGDSTFTATVNSGATSSGGVSSGGTGGGSGGGSGSSAPGGNGGSSGTSGNNNQNTGVSSQLSVYDNLSKSIGAMLSAYGKTVASPATGTITVVDTPDVLDRVAAFVETENLAMMRQVAVNVTVLSVTLNDADQFGINWNLVYSNLLNNYGIRNTLQVPGTAFSAGVIDAKSKFAGSTLVIQALAEQGKVRRQTTASVVTLNNQPVPVQVATQTSYLQSSQTTSNGLSGTTTSLTPGTVTSGFNMSILPHILNNGTVMLQFTTDISSLLQLREVNSGGSKIETPEMQTRNFLQRVAMKSNETLIISGFEQSDENLSRQGVGQAENWLLGGGAKRKSNKEIMVVLITPTAMAGS